MSHNGIVYIALLDTNVGLRINHLVVTRPKDWFCKTSKDSVIVSISIFSTKDVDEPHINRTMCTLNRITFSTTGQCTKHTFKNVKLYFRIRVRRVQKESLKSRGKKGYVSKRETTFWEEIGPTRSNSFTEKLVLGSSLHSFVW